MKGVYMKKLLGFTLSELMIALAVLGILCATVLPAITNNTPNQNKMMMKKSYFVFQEVIDELINDSNNYPMSDGYCKDKNADGYVGFDCGDAEKLPYLFSKHINMDERITETQAAFKNDTNYSKSSLADCFGVANSCYILKTSDGISWAFPKSTFTKGTATSSIRIGIDVNGDKKPNCYQGSTSCSSRTKNFDQYRIKLYNDGIMEIYATDVWAKNAINVNSTLTGDN